MKNKICWDKFRDYLSIEQIKIYDVLVFIQDSRSNPAYWCYNCRFIFKIEDEQTEQTKKCMMCQEHVFVLEEILKIYFAICQNKNMTSIPYW